MPGRICSLDKGRIFLLKKLAGRVWGIVILQRHIMSICSTLLVFSWSQEGQTLPSRLLSQVSFLKITLNSYFCSVGTRELYWQTTCCHMASLSLAYMNDVYPSLAPVRCAFTLWTRCWVMKSNNLQKAAVKPEVTPSCISSLSAMLLLDVLGNVKYLSAVHAKPHDQTTQKRRLTCYRTWKKSIYNTENRWFVSSYPILQVTGNTYSF